ncbi:hypothetical protein BVRB_011760 [Beta vulgaris subsp. vulgaris]|uniref:Uncharacterized protein n=1 Tax=Beta vulgaris subsp. vulgaris TaxID=3555 RepID=A0A0J8DWD1_BETVV|nr:hypothetical protein BVRB_011760 [Beta vulgaris subsp. vulgaris]
MITVSVIVHSLLRTRLVHYFKVQETKLNPGSLSSYLVQPLTNLLPLLGDNTPNLLPPLSLK